MLRRVIAIRNVGRFRSSAIIPNPEFARHTLIFAPNGYGKTTFCSILRSAQSGDPAPVLGRRTLGRGDPSSNVELLFATEQLRFQGGAWSARYPNISIFDGVFIAENVHSGDFVDVANRRNLYRVIIGRTGVELAQREQALAEESRAKQAALTAVGRAIQTIAPPDTSLADFLTIPLERNVDARIAAQQQVLAALQDAATMRARAALRTLTIPALSFNARALLAKSLEGIGTDVEAALRTHIEQHRMGENGERWLAEGVGYIRDDHCPFCGRDGLDALSLVQTYRAIFDGAYRALLNELSEARRDVESALGEVVQAELRTAVAQNLASTEFWRRYCAIDPAGFPPIGDAVAACARAHLNLRELLERKALSPLERVERPCELDDADAALREAQASVALYNRRIVAVNELVDAAKRAVAAGDPGAARGELARLQAAKHRHEPTAIEDCAEYQRLDAEKRTIEHCKAAVREQLERHTRRVIRPYEERINHYLVMFNADFRLTQTRHGYPGGIATSIYRLSINGCNVDLGDNRTPNDRPSFRNTLSTGDRATLALAFFLAHLEREPDLTREIVVFDDPFNSQDSFRRSQTLYEIMRVAGVCAQVIVLSHDAVFLKQLWVRSPPAERVAMQFVCHPGTGSRICSFDLDKACRGRGAAELDDLMAFRATGAGDPREVVKKLRVVLETHFRTSYPAAFLTNDNFGAILGKIRAVGEHHPAFAAYDFLDRINDYAAQYHHGEDARGAPEPPLDPTELMGFVNMTLALVNALPA